MRGNVVKEIDGQTYEIWHLPTEPAVKMLVKLTKLIGGPVGKAISGLTSSSGSILDANVGFDFIGAAIGMLTNKLDEDEVLGIVKTMLKYVNKKTEKGGFIEVDLDVDFQGKIMHLLNVVRAALEHNFSDFFVGIKSRLKEVLPALKSEQSSKG